MQFKVISNKERLRRVYSSSSDSEEEQRRRGWCFSASIVSTLAIHYTNNNDLFCIEKTPIPPVEASDDRLGSPILSPEEEPRDSLLDRVYSDSEEEREYQVQHKIYELLDVITIMFKNKFVNRI